MRLLLDTHVVLWWVTGHPKLGTGNSMMIEDDLNEVFVSVVSIWEIAIKFARPKGRLDDMPISGRQAREIFEAARVEVLPVTPAHAAAIDDLPPLHGDPFDRMLVAQAAIEGMRLMTRDVRLKPYGAMVIAV